MLAPPGGLLESRAANPAGQLVQNHSCTLLSPPSTAWRTPHPKINCQEVEKLVSSAREAVPTRPSIRWCSPGSPGPGDGASPAASYRHQGLTAGCYGMGVPAGSKAPSPGLWGLQPLPEVELFLLLPPLASPDTQLLKPKTCPLICTPSPTPFPRSAMLPLICPYSPSLDTPGPTQPLTPLAP